MYVALEVDAERLEDAVKGLRAINTVVNDNGVLTGYCTDGIG